jgi:hypothetical protein
VKWRDRFITVKFPARRFEKARLHEARLISQGGIQVEEA